MRRLLLPGAVLALALAVDQGWLTAGVTPRAVVQAERAAFGVAFLLAVGFRRGRSATAAVALAAAAEALRAAPASSAVVPAVAFLLPLNLALLAFLEERRIFSAAGLARFALLGFQGTAVLALARAGETGTGARVAEILRASWIEAPDLSWTQPAVASFGIACVALAWRYRRSRAPLDAGLLGTLAAAFVAAGSFAGGETGLPRRDVFWLAAGAVLVLAQLENAFRLAFEDGLTGLPARRALDERLRQLGRRYAIAMVDVDHFKRLNDRHGHEVGDQVLRLIAGRLARVRGGGAAYRYGGEEFAVVFPGKSAKEVAPRLEELRGAIAGQPFVVRGPGRPRRKPRKSRGRGGGGGRVKVTVSVGVADRNAKRPRPDLVIKAADRALYRSKKAGRNRLTVA